MEQEIRFCKASDGVGIAYGISGEGPPLLYVHGWGSHLEFARTMPGFEQSVWNLLAQRHRFVRYDGRGFGLSDRGVKDLSVDRKVLDVEAVADSLGLDRFAIMGISEGGPTAMVYAHRHPERVTKLVLTGTFAKPALPTTDAEIAELRVKFMAFQAGWEKGTPEYRQLWGAQFVPDGSPEIVNWFNEMGRLASDGATMGWAMSAVGGINVTHIAADINVPTLVMHARGDRAVPFESGRELAALIPGARFVPLEGNNHIPLPGEPQTMRIVQVTEEFLGGAPLETPTAAATGGSLVTILFTDMEGSTALTQQLGDERAQQHVRQHNTAVRDALVAHAGKEIKHTGDGIMASFASARGAVDCAVAIQRALAVPSSPLAREVGEGSGVRAVRVRIGLNAGEPVAEEHDLYGTSVQLAARVCAEADGGEILVSNVVRELAAGKSFLFNDRGERPLKGFEDPVRLYEVNWRG